MSFIKKWIVGHQLAMLVIAALAVTGILTGFGLWLYRFSGAVKLDMSRPGYETVREAVDYDDDSTKPFSSSGELDAAAITDFQERWAGISERLEKMHDFDAAVLSDENLGLGSDAAGDGG